MIILIASKYLIYIILSFKNIFKSSIYKIKKKRKIEGLEKITKEYILNEFDYLKKITDMDESHNKRLDTKYMQFCRYSDITTYKDNRVKIPSKFGYINASWIHMPYINHFIATQGPLDSTIDDFWDMCFNYNVKVIVMLCKLKENEREKCANYWESNLKKYKLIKSNDEKSIDEGLIIRNFKMVKKDGPNFNSKDIIQIHLTTWDDHTAPTSNFNKIQIIIDFVDKFKKNSPVVVHCSAGVGRTGTFIGLYNLHNEITRQINNIHTRDIKFSILNLVRKLKEMRLYLVENEDQYILLYEFAMKILNENNI